MIELKTPLARLMDVSVERAQGTALARVDFEISPGEIVTIVGPNGSGKSTLVRLVLGALAPSTGKAWRKPKLRIGYVPQKLALDPTLPMTVRRFLNLPGRASDEDATRVLSEVGATGLEKRQLAELSGGQFQRVLLARALLGDPELLILDEATQGLDQPGAAAFYRLIEAQRQKLGCGVLMVSHELHVVMAASDRVICLNGHICCQGAPETVVQDAQYRALFGTGTQGTLAIYRHEHDHSHDHDGTCAPDCDHSHDFTPQDRVR